MSCETFRMGLSSGDRSDEWLEHLRACDSCLPIALETEPELLFRSIGGGELVPPGGVDEFVAEVMGEVRLRRTEKTVAFRPRVASVYRWAAAAAVVFVIAAGTFLRNEEAVSPSVPVAARSAAPVAGTGVELVNKPIVEEYQSASATIVEVSAESNDDTKIVMIFDESLPVDL